MFGYSVAESWPETPGKKRNSMFVPNPLNGNGPLITDVGWDEITARKG
jgi:hypothetical protein